MAQHAPERPNAARVVKTCSAQEDFLHTLRTCQATLGTLQLFVYRGVCASCLSLPRHGQACIVNGDACKASRALATPSNRAAALHCIAFLATITAGTSSSALQPSTHHPVLASPPAN